MATAESNAEAAALSRGPHRQFGRRDDNARDRRHLDAAQLPDLLERFRRFLKDSGYTPNEIQAVFRPAEGSAETLDGVFDLERHMAHVDTLFDRVLSQE